VIGCGLDDQGSFPGRGRDISIYYGQTSSHNLLSIAYWGVKGLQPKDDHTPLSSAKVKNA